MLKRRAFVPQINDTRLEDRVVLTTTAANFVIAPAGVAQNSINFTSNTYHSVISSLSTISHNFAVTGNVTAAEHALAQVSLGIPFGQKTLLPIWLTDLQTLQTGARLTNAEATTEVNALYETLLGRAPDAGGEAGFVSALEQGASFTSVVTVILNSPEYASINTTPDDFVGSLYTNVLGRTGTTGEIDAWVATGDTNAEIVSAFLAAPETLTSPTSIFQTIQITPTANYYFGTGAITGPFGTQPANLVYQDLLAYLRNGVGVNFNVLKSTSVHWNTDSQLIGIYNGTTCWIQSRRGRAVRSPPGPEGSERVSPSTSPLFPFDREFLMAALTGRVAIVTGGSRAIGRAIAERLADDGAAVVVNFAQGRDDADATVAAIVERGGRALAVQADLATVAGVRSLFAQAAEALGRLDILVNNAAIYRQAAFEEITEADYDAVFNLNVRGVLFCLQEAARRMADGGRIINISSDLSVQPDLQRAVYGASKAAIDHFTRVAARELGRRGITVNSVLPGPTVPGMFALVPEEIQRSAALRSPMGRLGTPGDIADVVAFLASESARWVTGQVILATGGG